MGLDYDWPRSIERHTERIPKDLIDTVDIQIRSPAQLFDSLDPSPFQKRAPDHNA